MPAAGRGRPPSVGRMLGITAEAAANLAIVVAIALVVLAALFAKVLIGNLAKIAAAIALVAAAIFVWSQRASLQDCADQVKARARDGVVDAECRVSGLTFTVDLER